MCSADVGPPSSVSQSDRRDLLEQVRDYCHPGAGYIDEFGGLHGIRDEGALESALVAVENRQHYENADLLACAATYAYHIAKAHAFIDGNKRTAAAATEVFLLANDTSPAVTNAQFADLFIGLAWGEISRDEAEALLRSWLRL